MPIMVEKGAVIRFLDKDGNEVSFESRVVIGGNNCTAPIPEGAVNIELLGVWEHRTGRND